MSLTPLGTVLVLGALLLGAVGQWSEALGAVPWWRVAVAALVLGLAYELIATRRASLGARWASAERLYLGRLERLTLEIESRSARPLALRLAPVWPTGIAASAYTASVEVSPAAVTSARFGIRAVALGRHVWPKLPARVRGPLGLAWWSVRLDPGSAAHVVPDTLGRRKAIAGSAERGAASQAALGGARELHHLRAYRAGDARHTIDWKATARASRLITRVFTEDQHLEVMILLDAGRTSRTEIDGMTQLGHYVNLAARFAEYCIAGEDRVGLVVFADETLRTLAPGRGEPAVVQMRAALSDLEPSAAESDVLNAALHVRRLVRHRCLTIILTDLYERSSTSQLAQTARFLAPKHLPMIVGLQSLEILALAGAAASDWLDPYRSLAAREYQRDVEANVARLTRLGAHALVARPADLDAKVLGEYKRLRAQRRI